MRSRYADDSIRSSYVARMRLMPMLGHAAIALMKCNVHLMHNGWNLFKKKKPFPKQFMLCNKCYFRIQQSVRIREPESLRFLNNQTNGIHFNVRNGANLTRIDGPTEWAAGP